MGEVIPWKTEEQEPQESHLRCGCGAVGAIPCAYGHLLCIDCKSPLPARWKREGE